MNSLSVTLGVKLASPLNGASGHSRIASILRSRERAKVRNIALGAVFAEMRRTKFAPAWPIVVTLTRISAGKLDDDNLAASFKAVRDGVAEALEIKDNDPRVTWIYGQEKCGRGQYGARVLISQRTAERMAVSE